MHLKDAIIHGVDAITYDNGTLVDGDEQSPKRHVFMIKEGITGSINNGNLQISYETSSPASTPMTDNLDLSGLKNYYLGITKSGTTATISSNDYSTINFNGRTIKLHNTGSLVGTANTVTFTAEGTNVGATLALTRTGNGVSTITVDGNIVYHAGNIGSYTGFLKTESNNPRVNNPLTVWETGTPSHILQLWTGTAVNNLPNVIKDIIETDPFNNFYLGSVLSSDYTASTGANDLYLIGNNIYQRKPTFSGSEHAVDYNNYRILNSEDDATYFLASGGRVFTGTAFRQNSDTFAFYKRDYPSPFFAATVTENSPITVDVNTSSGITNINGILSLDYSGLASLTGSLEVSGGTTLDSTLNVVGTSTFSGVATFLNQIKRTTNPSTLSTKNSAGTTGTGMNVTGTGYVYDTRNYPFLSGIGTSDDNNIAKFNESKFDLQYTSIPSALAVARFVNKSLTDYTNTVGASILALQFRGSLVPTASSSSSSLSGSSITFANEHTIANGTADDKLHAGDTYIVNVTTAANKYFGNQVVESGDMIIYKGTITNNKYSTDMNDWVVIQRNIDPTYYVTTNTALDITANKTFSGASITVTGGSITTPTLNVSGTGTIATLSSTNATITNLTTTTTATFSGATTAETLNVTGLANFTNIINGDINGNAVTATKLLTARSLQVNLGSTSSVSFDGSADKTEASGIGVYGILPLGKVNTTNLNTVFLGLVDNTYTAGTYPNNTATGKFYNGLVPAPQATSTGEDAVYPDSTYFLSATAEWIKLEDTKVTQTVKTDNVTYPIVGSNVAVSTSSGTTTVAKFDVLTYNPSTYSLTNGGCTMQYNSTNKCLTFNFS